MERNILYNLLLLPLAIFTGIAAMAQTTEVADQNPNYMISQAMYMDMADSLNSLHGTTIQQTYKAIDWMEQRREMREQRRAFRRELRLERARRGWYYNDGYYHGGYYNNGFYNDYGYYNNYYPGYSNNYYYSPYRYRRSGWNNNGWTMLGVGAALGWWLAR